MFGNLYAWQGSNLRPPAPEAGALSTELQAHGGDCRIGYQCEQNLVLTQFELNNDIQNLSALLLCLFA
jgi:hypothetical protein